MFEQAFAVSAADELDAEADVEPRHADGHGADAAAGCIQPRGSAAGHRPPTRSVLMLPLALDRRRDRGWRRPMSGSVRQFSALVASLPDKAIIAVDMPIGLPKGRSFCGAGRTGLILAKGSVECLFHSAACCCLCRRLSCESCSLSLERTGPRKVSRQAGLFPKICEIDELLRCDLRLADRIIESHPELAFAVLNGMKAMSLPKKIKSRVNPEGMAERRALLQHCGLPEDFEASRPARCQGG